MSGPVQSPKKKIDDDTAEEEKDADDDMIVMQSLCTMIEDQNEIRNVKECAVAMTSFILVLTFDLRGLAIDSGVLVEL